MHPMCPNRIIANEMLDTTKDPHSKDLLTANAAFYNTDAAVRILHLDEQIFVPAHWCHSLCIDLTYVQLSFIPKLNEFAAILLTVAAALGAACVQLYLQPFSEQVVYAPASCRWCPE